MRTPVTLLAALALLLLAPSAQAQEPPQNPNAALDYWRAWALSVKPGHAGEDSPWTKIRPLWEKIGANTDPAAMPEEFNKARADLSEDAMTHFLRAAAAPRCDFQVHLEDGWKALLPELAIVRDLSTQARVAARLKLMAGDSPAATDRVLAMYQSARHVATEPVLIASLVGAAITRGADDEARTLAASGRLAEPDRARLLAAVKSMQAGDPLGFRAAFEGERMVTAAWIKRDFSGPGAGARFAKEMRDMIAAGEDEKARGQKVADLTDEQFAKACRDFDAFYALLLRAWDQGRPALVALDQRLQKEEFGPLTAFMAPAMLKAYDAFEKVRSDLAATEAALRKKP